MTRYYPGVYSALEKVDTMTEQECISYMNSLYGTENLRYGASLEEVRDELRRQIRLDFTDSSDPAHDAWVKAMADACKSRKY